jgi:hypothetical protein
MTKYKPLKMPKAGSNKENDSVPQAPKNGRRAGRKADDRGAPYIQYLRSENRLFGLEVGVVTRILKRFKATVQNDDVKTSAGLLLKGIMQGRDIFAEYLLIPEYGQEERSRTNYICGLILSELSAAITTAHRAKLPR